LEKVQRLREASFLLAREVLEGEGATLRFSMLESLREFGLGQLAPEEIDAGYERLTRYLITLGSASDFALIHVENVRLAAHWCRQSDLGAKLELPLFKALKHFWYQRGGWIEGRDWLQEALRRHAGEETPEHPGAWNVLGALHWFLHETAEAKRCFEKSRALAEKLGDDATAVRALNNLGMAATQEGDLVRACELGEQSLRFAQRLEDEVLVTNLLNNAGSAYMSLGDYDTARRYLEESLRRSRENGLAMAAMSLANLGALAEKLGDLEAARRMYEESIAMMRAWKEHSVLADTLALLARVVEAQGEKTQAYRLLEEREALIRQLKGE
jgi:tetratricopeptide (TPR) repeat protein